MSNLRKGSKLTNKHAIVYKKRGKTGSNVLYVYKSFGFKYFSWQHFFYLHHNMRHPVEIDNESILLQFTYVFVGITRIFLSLNFREMKHQRL